MPAPVEALDLARVLLPPGDDRDAGTWATEASRAGLRLLLQLHSFDGSAAGVLAVYPSAPAGIDPGSGRRWVSSAASDCVVLACPLGRALLAGTAPPWWRAGRATEKGLDVILCADLGDYLRAVTVRRALCPPAVICNLAGAAAELEAALQRTSVQLLRDPLGRARGGRMRSSP